MRSWKISSRTRHTSLLRERETRKGRGGKSPEGENARSTRIELENIPFECAADTATAAAAGVDVAAPFDVPAHFLTD